MTANSEPLPSADTERLSASIERGRESMENGPDWWRGRPRGTPATGSLGGGAPPYPPHIEAFQTAITPRGKIVRNRRRRARNPRLTVRADGATSIGHEWNQIDLR